MCTQLAVLWKCGHDSRVMKAEKESKAIWESNNITGRETVSLLMVVGVEEKTDDSQVDGRSSS